ncbi:MAG: flagellar basal body protein FliL [Deltaproteobacteria bacterium]|nr:flagellar basal body protein FliL [Deltaproteobacteria bacterium]
MAAETQAVTAEAPVQKKRKWGKIILLFLGVFILAGGGGLAYIILFDDPPPPGKGNRPPKAQAPQALMPLDPFLVNLADKDARRYLKLKLELEVDSEKSIKELEKSLPRIRDALILLLSTKTYAELATAEGKLQLKGEILQRLTKMPGGQKIIGAYFTEFIAQ